MSTSLLASVFVVGFLMLSLSSAGAQTHAPPVLEVEIAPNVSPHLLPGEVAAIVEDVHTHGSRLSPAVSSARQRPRVTKVTCLKGTSYRDAIPSARFATLPWDTVWVAEIDGRIVKATPHGNVASERGFYVVDDATGKIVARGAF